MLTKKNNINSRRYNIMPVNLGKGGKVSLTKAAEDAGVAGLSKIVVGLGWNTNRYDGGSKFDLDASAFLVKEDGKVRNEKDFVFYGNTAGDGVTHTGDNTTGEGDGDDERIVIDLNAVPADVQKIAFAVTIYEADKRNQNFGMVEDSYIRVIDEVTGTELIRYDLGEDYSIETAVVVGELYRHNGEWKFNAIGSGFQGGLAALCGNYGIDAA
jgi:tellurium resistance protein TerD